MSFNYIKYSYFMNKYLSDILIVHERGEQSGC